MRRTNTLWMKRQEDENIILHAVNKYGEKLMSFIKPKVKIVKMPKIFGKKFGASSAV